MEEKNKQYYNRTLYLKEFTKELTMVLPAQELKAAPPFSPILSQYGLNANEFCEKFNKETIKFPIGTPIPTSIFYIPKEKKFNFCFRPFQLKHILQQYVKYDEVQRIYIIDYLDLYKALLMKIEILNEKNLPRILRNILGTLKSYEKPLMIQLPQKILKKHNIIIGEYPVEIEETEEETEDYTIETETIVEKKPNNQNFWKNLKNNNNNL